LRYLYTGDCEITAEAFHDIRYVAKKYSIDALASACDNFLEEGLTAENACGLFGSEITGNADLAFAYIEEFTTETIDSQSFLDLSYEKVLKIVKSNELSVDEVHLFERVIDWGKEECERQKLTNTPENMRAVLRDLIGFIRFPLISMEDLAAIVSPTEVLSSEDLLSVFTYLGTQGTTQVKTKFEYHSRRPRRPNSTFKWDPHRISAGITLTGDGTIATCHSSSWCGLIGDAEWKKGMYEWEFTLETFDRANTYAICIGVVPSNANHNIGTLFGYSTHPGWSFICGNGQICTPSKGSGAITWLGQQACSVGDRVGCRLDLDSGTLEYFRNGKKLGVAFTDVVAPVRPSVSLINNQSIRLSFRPNFQRRRKE